MEKGSFRESFQSRSQRCRRRNLAGPARGLEPGGAWCPKCGLAREWWDIRHCGCLMGPRAAGKSECWRVLAKARELMGPELKTGIWDVNPKAVETQELYGYISMATREWKDGLLSTVMRNIGAIPDELPKWIMLDGDLDANWIESMNSVMDDNRLLTLASNERIPLKPHMRMIFEIRDLKHATPATVSRAGILYISTDEGFQWRSMVNTWILTREESKGFTAEAKAWLTANFDEVVAPALLSIRKLLFNVAQQQTTLVNNILRLLDAFCTPDMLAPEEHCQMTFSFCAAWALGSALGVADDGKDYMKVFSEWWKKTFKKRISFPGQGLIFDYWLDTENWAFESWTESPARPGQTRCRCAPRRSARRRRAAARMATPALKKTPRDWAIAFASEPDEPAVRSLALERVQGSVAFDAEVKMGDSPGSDNGTGLFQTLCSFKIREAYEKIAAAKA